MYAYGTPFDGITCTTFYTCQSMVYNGVHLHVSGSSMDPEFSRAYAWFPPGTHTVLIRLENPLGCGNGHWLTGGNCFGAGNVGFRVIQRVCPATCLRWPDWHAPLLSAQ